MFVIATLAGLILLFCALSTAMFENVPPIWSKLLLKIQSVQRDLHIELAEAIQAVKTKGLAASWVLISLSFFYGIFHAAGPGHGKVVISTYILTHESQLRRGLLISVVCALCQGFTAILVVAFTAGLLDFTLRQAQGTVVGLEALSYSLVAILGLILVLSRVISLSGLIRNSTTRIQEDLPRSARGQQNKNYLISANCGHVHGPSRNDLETPLSWKSFSGIVASIGLRPCSGAVLVLLAAFALNLHWAGVGAVLAMSVGTAITVSALACLSIYARKGALRLTSLIPAPIVLLKVSLDLFAIFGGLVILIVGGLMLQAAFSVPEHPFR